MYKGHLESDIKRLYTYQLSVPQAHLIKFIKLLLGAVLEITSACTAFQLHRYKDYEHLKKIVGDDKADKLVTQTYYQAMNKR